MLAGWFMLSQYVSVVNLSATHMLKSTRQTDFFFLNIAADSELYAWSTAYGYGESAGVPNPS